MRVTATNKPLRVDYRLAGRSYNNTNGDIGDAQETDTRTAAPFDSMHLAVGQSADFEDDTDVVRVISTGDNPQPEASADGPSA